MELLDRLGGCPGVQGCTGGLDEWLEQGCLVVFLLNGQLFTFSTIEEFWAVYDNLPLPSQLPQRNYFFFRVLIQCVCSIFRMEFSQRGRMNSTKVVALGSASFLLLRRKKLTKLGLILFVSYY